MLSYPVSYSPSAVIRSTESHMPSELVGVAGFEPAVSSSRSQIPAGTTSFAACLAWNRQSMDVR
jgi:hypothetical protein